MRIKRVTAIVLAAVFILGMTPAAHATGGGVTIGLVVPPATTEYTVEKGTVIDSLLPSSLQAIFSDGTESSIDVSWSSPNYNNTIADTYTFTAANATYIGVAWPSVYVTVAHKVTLPSGTGYTASFLEGSSALVKNGESVSFEVEPSEHYTLPDNGVSVSSGAFLSDGGGSYTISQIADDISVYVSVTPETFTLTTSKDAHSAIDPNTTYDYSATDTITVSFSAGTGYAITGVTVDGAALSDGALSSAAASGYVTLDKKSGHSVAVTASQATGFTVTFMNGTATAYTCFVPPGGHASYSGGTPAKSGSGSASYTFAGWSATNTTTFTSNTQPVTLSTLPITANTTLYAVYTLSASGVNLGVALDNVSGYTFSGATAGNSSIVSQLYSHCSATLGTALTRVRFGAQSSSFTQYGTLYTNSSKTSLSASVFYYYASSGNSSYPLGSVYFEPTGTAGTYNISYTAYDAYGNSMSGILYIAVTTDTGTITCSTSHGIPVQLDASDFYEYYDDYGPNGSLRYVEFDTGSSFGSSYGNIYYDYGGAGETSFTNSTIDNYEFYYNSSSYGDFPLGNLYFVPGTNNADYTVSIGFTAYYNNASYVEGTLKLEVSGGGSITCTTKHDTAVQLEASDFYTYFDNNGSTGSLRYVTFDTGASFGNVYGNIYYDYGGAGETGFTNSTIDNYKFYYSSSSYGNYPLGNLYFVPGSNVADYTISIGFTACYSSSVYVKGTLKLQVSGRSEISAGDTVYNTTKNNAVTIDAGDIAEFFHKTYTSSDLKYVLLGGVPQTGSLYYNYSGGAVYGSGSAVKLTGSNYDDYTFYYNPTSTNLYTLSALTYVPSGSNYCVSIPFTAYYSGTRYVSGTILINVTTSALSEIYYATIKNTNVKVSTSDFTAAVSAATSSTPATVKFSALPPASQGTLYYSYTSANNYGHKVSASYSYSCTSSGTYKLANITFVPYTGFTGSVSVPYTAYNAAGTAIAVGKLSFGVMNSIKYFYDVQASTWYYKYVSELRDNSVVSGYPDGTFKPSGVVTYGEALKLIMLAAGYSQKAPTGAHWASGYLSRALTDKLLPASVNLDTVITRLEIAGIAAKALDLDAPSIGTPFADTSNANVLTLYEKGVIEGSFNSSGLRYFYPSTSITRAEISAIIWRMNNLGDD